MTDVSTEAIKDNFVPSVRKALAQSKLGFFEKSKIRIALMFPHKVEEIRQMCFDAAIDQQAIAADVNIMAIDWDKLISVIEKLIPLILKIISMFPAMLPFILCLSLAGLGNNSFAQEPKAVIKGPDTVLAGTLLFLNHDDSVGESRLWMITDELKSAAAVCGNNIFFAVSKPGDYKFGLTVASIVDGKVKQDYVFKTIKVTGSSPEQPPIVVPPVPTPGFVQLRTKSIQATSALADYDTGIRLNLALTNIVPQIPVKTLLDAKVLVISTIDQVLLTRAGESKKKDWLNTWRIPVSNELNSMNIQDAETYAKAINALSSAICLNGKCPIP